MKICMPFMASGWFHGVVPLGMEASRLDVDGFHLSSLTWILVGVGVGVEAGVDLEAGAGCGGGDQVDHGLVADERLGAPVDRDVAEQAVLDLG